MTNFFSFFIISILLKKMYLSSCAIIKKAFTEKLVSGIQLSFKSKALIIIYNKNIII